MRADAISEESSCSTPDLSETGTLLYSFRTLRIILSIVLYAILAPWGYLAFAIITAWPSQDQKMRRQRLQFAIRTGFRVMLAWIHHFRLMRIQLPSAHDMELQTPCVVVANHPCHLDIVGIFSWLPNAFTVVKPSIYRQFWLKPLLRGSGQLEGGQTHLLEVERLISESVQRLRSGQNLVIFPEGTRTIPGREMPFHRLAFEIACRANVPVVPLRLSCYPSYLSKERSILCPPRGFPSFRVEVFGTLYPQDFQGNSRRMRETAKVLCVGRQSRKK